MILLKEAIDAYEVEKREQVAEAVLQTMAGATADVKTMGIENRAI